MTINLFRDCAQATVYHGTKMSWKSTRSPCIPLLVVALLVPGLEWVKKDDFVGAQQSYLPHKAVEQR